MHNMDHLFPSIGNNAAIEGGSCDNSCNNDPTKFLFAAALFTETDCKFVSLREMS